MKTSTMMRFGLSMSTFAAHAGGAGTLQPPGHSLRTPPEDSLEANFMKTLQGKLSCEPLGHLGVC